jgi:hypothetical protein
VMKLVVPLDSCPNGAHLPQVLNSVRHCSYWVRSAAVSGGAGGAGGVAWASVLSIPPTQPAMTRPAHTVTDARRFRMRSSTAFLKSSRTGIPIFLAGQESSHDTRASDADDTHAPRPDKAPGLIAETGQRHECDGCDERFGGTRNPARRAGSVDIRRRRIIAPAKDGAQPA